MRTKNEIFKKLSQINKVQKVTPTETLFGDNNSLAFDAIRYVIHLDSIIDYEKFMTPLIANYLPNEHVILAAASAWNWKTGNSDRISFYE